MRAASNLREDDAARAVVGDLDLNQRVARRRSRPSRALSRCPTPPSATMPCPPPPEPSMRLWPDLSAVTLVLVAALAAPLQAGEPEDLAAARALFDRNLAAIHDHDRDAYLACYLQGEGLVRAGFTGSEQGFDRFAQALDDDWPVTLEARDVSLHWLAPGLVHASYRYRVIYRDGVPHEGLSERLFRETEDGWRIVVTTAFEQPAGTPAPPVALVHATVYDGGSGPPLDDAVIVVRDGRIVALGPAASTDVPPGVDVVDLGGRFVTPGLIDTHVHYSQTGWADGRPDACDVRDRFPYAQVQADLAAHPERFHRAFLHSGVTAVLDTGGFGWTRTLGARTENDPEAPHVLASGPLLTTWDPGSKLALPEASQFVLMSDDASVRAAVASHKALGSDAIKVWFIVTGERPLDELGRLCAVAGEEARRAGLPLIVHATGLAEAKLAVAAGVHLLVHSVGDQPVDDDFVQACVAGKVFYCPTLTVMHGYAALFDRQLSDELRGQLPAVDASVRDRVLATESLPPDGRSSPAAREQRDRDFESRDRIMADNLLRLHRAGVRVVLGTDAGNPLTLHGPSVFPELEAMQAAGLTAQEVLTAATRDAAAAIGREKDLGVIAVGRVADLVVLDEDPGTDATHWRSIQQVMRAGLLRAREQLAGR